MTEETVITLTQQIIAKHGAELSKAWGELKKLGISPDGNTSVAQAIAKFCVRKQAL